MATLTNKQPRLDRQAIAAIFAGTLLLAISFLTNYGHGALLNFHSLALDEQIGVCLHATALAALIGDAELATRLRDRARNQETERAQFKTQCDLAEFRFLLADTPRNRNQLNEIITLLLEKLKACIKGSADDAAFIARPWATSAELRASHRSPATLTSQEKTFTRHDQAKKPFANNRGMMTKGLGNQGTTP